MSLRRSRLRAASVLTVCLTALAPATVTAASAPPGDQALQRQLDAFVRHSGGPPGAIAVLRTENGTRVVRAGVADVGTDRRPGSGDHMRIASTAKAFSGAVALTLVDRGALDLDDTLGERLPQLPDAWGSVTLRQLLNHTSGLPDYSRSEGFIAELQADPLHHFDSRRLLDYVADQPLLFAPGTQYRYSNSDNIAVALMAEAVTRKPYEGLLRDLVYAPLGLRSTSLPQGNRMPAPYLHGYAVNPPAAPEDVSEIIGMSGVWASGGIVSTPADMTRFIRGYAAGRLYGGQAVQQQRQWVEGASEPAGPGRNSAGLAVFRYETRCGVVLGHTGNTLGYTQLIAATPDGRRSLTFSVTSQITQSSDAKGLKRMRAVQENFVCAMLRGGNQ
ncbi:serine hydrolase [Streptomyces sp. RP5T]|uniref:serine hydrolase domain-containing protein n=1 Tax=Streptomyces sp. RP5T TaxID=2490848 RepID=UPI000F654427|nr:serine hydrolase domain-containing protein [Streptomyces sp. RP5T]RRR75530.1 class A beta-lactamase-related serine hydrolase [Streptomyces sp. RP5T]